MFETSQISKLSDVLSVPLKTRLTFFCTVAESQSLFRAATGSFFTNLTLVCTTLDNAVIELCVFFKRRTQMPRLRQPGDVILLHNAVVHFYEDERNLKLSLDHSDAGYALFDPSSPSTTPYAQQGEVFVITGALEPILDCAKEYALIWRAEHPDYYTTETERRLDQLEPSDEVDVACNILATDLKHDPKLLWAWDGRDVVPADLRQGDSTDVRRFGPIFAQTCSNLPQPVSQFDQQPLPSQGSLVPIVILGERRLEDVPKGWVKLHSLGCLRFRSQWILLYGDATRWAAVPRIPSLHEQYLERLESQHGVTHMDPTAVMTRVSGHPLVHVRLRAVYEFLHHAIRQGERVQHDFRCYCYLMRCEPRAEAITTALLDTHQPCSIEFHLQDGTGHPSHSTSLEGVSSGRVEATLYGKHVVDFFNLHQREAFGDDWARTQIMNTVSHALMSNDPVPWLDVCLRVIYRDGHHAVQMLDTIALHESG